MMDFNSQNRTQMILLVIAGTLFMMALIVTFTRQVLIALVAALVVILVLFVSKVISSGRGVNNAPPNLPEHIDDMSGRWK